ncbi:dienelactone hydrolase family protein [Nonomuraea sp. NPDC005650]|uniref:poly(ethylene terephthalate) hydrolase family protein n=1 Tax=Nonomuraea sp. NPDC005650 TaxID=3157045 RepID=UPI0033A025B9
MQLTFARTLAVLATLTAVVAATAPAQASAGPYQRGPDPTEAALEAARGPYSISETDVSSLVVTGFGGGTIYYPTTTADGTFGAVAIAPGYTETRSALAWLARRVASHGFVVFNIDTNSTTDQPASRGRQLLAALDYLTQSSSVRNRVDAGRLGVMGHSMGGGGSLEAASSRPSLQATVPLTPWNLDKSWSEVQVPTMIIGAENDSIAPVTTHAEPFYNSLPSSLDKAYLELDGAGHLAPTSTNPTIGKFGVSWLKRFIDDDLRYEQFLCPPPVGDRDISEYRDTCPHS